MGKNYIVTVSASIVVMDVKDEAEARLLANDQLEKAGHSFYEVTELSDLQLPAAKRCADAVSENV